MRKSAKSYIEINGQSWSSRELSQLIRRRMLTKSVKNKKKYSRKSKHNFNYGKENL